MISIFICILIGLLNLQFILAQTHSKDVTLRSQMVSTHKDRDPFSLPSGIHLLTREIEKAESIEDKRSTEEISTQNVKAILITKRTRLALIDHHIVSVGDSIRDEKVIDIRPDYVILSKGEKKRTLFLYKSNIPIRIDRN